MSSMKMYEILMSQEDYKCLEKLASYDFTPSKGDWLRFAAEDLAKRLFWYNDQGEEKYWILSHPTTVKFGKMTRRMTLYLGPIDIRNLEAIAESLDMDGLRGNLSEIFRIVIRDAYANYFEKEERYV